jgi:hypothetical protein
MPPKREKKYNFSSQNKTLQGGGIDQAHPVITSMHKEESVESSRHFHLVNSKLGQLGKNRNAQHVFYLTLTVMLFITIIFFAIHVRCMTNRNPLLQVYC